MNAPAPSATLMSGDDFRESLRRYKPRVFLDGQQVASVADERGFGPGINAIALTFDYALKPKYAPIMTTLPLVCCTAVMMGAYLGFRA